MRLCEGKGHAGGAKGYRTCEKCGERKAVSAFARDSAVCLKCARVCRICGERRAGKGDTRCDRCRKGPQAKFVTGINHQYIEGTRVSYEAWMSYIGATEQEHSVVRRALARYGRKEPSPDDIIAAFVGPEDYTPGGPPRRSGQLLHATALLAHEVSAMGRRELSAGIGSPGRQVA